MIIVRTTIYPLLVLAAATSASCASTKLKVGEQKVGAQGGISLSSSFVAFKKNWFKITFDIINDSPGPIIIMSEDVHCARGAVVGRIKDNFFTGPGKALNVYAGARKQFKELMCELPQSSGGSFSIAIDKVYENPNRDGVTKGNVLSQNVRLVLDASGHAIPGEVTAYAPQVAAGGAPGPAGAGGGAGPAAGSGGKAPKTDVKPVQATPVATASPGRAGPVAGADWVIAVMDVEDTNAGSKKGSIDPNLVRNIGDQLRVYIAQRNVRTIDRGAQDRAVQDSIQREKKESYKSCYDDSCQIELGKALAASHILRSKITRFGSKCVLNAELIDLKSEVTVAASSARGDCSAEGFLGMSEEAAGSLISVR